MSDAQVWTLIGGFFTILLGHTALVLRLVHVGADRITYRLDRLDRTVKQLADEAFEG